MYPGTRSQGKSPPESGAEGRFDEGPEGLDSRFLRPSYVNPICLPA
jgi:hypothetical protein